MSCQIPTSTLENALFQAYRQDFQKYKNLSAVIQSVIDQQIAPEAKIHAIWFYSGFVNSAAFTVEELQTPEWNAGVYSSIHEYLKPFLTGEKEFDYGNIMEGVKDLFPKAPAPAAPVSDIEVTSETYTSKLLRANPDKLFLFGDNNTRTGKRGQAVIRDEPNAIGISTKLLPKNTPEAFMSDAELANNKAIIDSDIQKAKQRAAKEGKIIVLPKGGFGTGLAALATKAPKTFAYLNKRLQEEFRFNNTTGELAALGAPAAPVSSAANTAEQKLKQIWTSIGNGPGRNALEEGWAESFGYLDETLSVGGQKYQAHGMGKSGFAYAIKDLFELLNKGIDPNRGGGQLYTGPLAISKENKAAASAIGTAGGTAYTDGAFVLVAKKGVIGIKSINDIGGILVNSGLTDINSEILNELRKAFPNLVIESYKNAKGLVEQLNQRAPLAAPVEIEIGNEQTLEERIESDIADIPVISDSNLTQYVDEIIQRVLDNAPILDTDTSGSDMSMTMMYLNKIRTELGSRKDSPGKVTLVNKIDNLMKSTAESLDQGANYVDLSKAEGIGKAEGGSNIVEYRRADGTKFEAVYDRAKRGYVYYAPGKEMHNQVIEQRPGDQKIEIYKLDNPARVDKQDGSIRIVQSELASGMILGDQSDIGQKGELTRDQMAAEMVVDQRLINQIRIIASTENAEFNLNRLNRIRESFPGIARLLETTELPAQSKLLGNGQGPILTFLRRTDGFTVTITNFKGDKSFELMPIADLAFVYSDNRVEEVDVNNPEHMERIKTMIQIRDESMFESVSDTYRYNNIVTEDEIEKFKKAVNTYKAFYYEVQRKISETGNSKNLDIRDIFNKYYSLTNSIRRIEYIEGKSQPDVSLGEYIDATEGRLDVKLEAYDENGNSTGEIKEAKLPVVLKQSKGTWEVVNSIPQGQKLIGDNGKSYVTVDAYLKDLGIDVITFAKQFSTNNAVYIGFKQAADEDVVVPYGIPLIYKQSLNTAADMVDFAASLRHAFQKAKIEKGVRGEMYNLNQKAWGFDVFDGIAIQFAILQQKGDKKVFGIRFEMLEDQDGTRTQEQIDRFNNYAKKMDIVLSEKSLNELFNAVDQILKSKNITLTQDMNSDAVSEKAFEAGFLMPIQSPQMQNLFGAYRALVDDVRNKFDNVVRNYESARDQGQVSPGLISDNFADYALFDDKAFKIKKRQMKEDLRTSFFTVKSNATKEFILSLKSSAKRVVMPTVRPKGPAKGINHDATSPVEPIDHTKPAIDPTVENPTIGEIIDPNSLTSEDRLDDLQYSLMQSLEGYIASSEEEFSAEIEAMRDLIPNAFQFMRKQGFENMNVDGHVLGYFQDMMIYLNDALKAKGVAYHEGFHAVFRRLLTAEQQTYYLKKVGEVLGDYKTDENGKYISVGGKKVYASEFRKQRRYVHLTDEQIRDLIYEEYMADSFSIFMETNKPPKTWMQKFFVFLKKLLNMFKKGGRIDNLFYDISLGKFKNAPIIEGQNDNLQLFSLDYKGIPYLASDGKGGIGFGNQTVPSYIVSELRDMMIYNMSALKMEQPDLRFNQLYNLARTKVMENYNIQNLKTENPLASESSIEQYKFHYDSARWLLGGLQDGQTFQFLNYTNSSQYDNSVVNNKIQTQISEFNATKFRNNILEEFKDIYKDSTFSDLDEMDYEMQQEDEEQESGQQFADVGFANKAPYDGSSYFRKLFKFIPYKYTDPATNITRTRMVDSRLIFSTIRKLTANLEKSQVVPAIIAEISRLNSEIRNYQDSIAPRLEDSQTIMPDDIAQMVDLRDQLNAVYNTLQTTVGVNSEGYATKNQHILSMFQDVFYTVDARLLQVQLKTTLEKDEKTGRLEKVKEQTYRTDDIVIGTDMHKIRTDMNARIATIFVDKESIASSIETLKRVNTIFGDKRNLQQEFFTQDGMFNDAAFERFVDDIYVAISKFNLNIPRQLIYVSLGFHAYDMNGGGLAMFNPGSKLRATLRLNKALLKNLKELRPTFWGSQLAKLIQDSSKRTEKEIGKFVTAYVNSAGEFLIKYNPTIGGSVTRDANGNLVNKYVKPTPAYMAIMKLQSVINPETGEVDIEEGLRTLAREYYDNQIDFFLDNPLLNSLVNPELSKDFLKEFEVSAFAGFSQSFGIYDNRKEGDTSTFKTIDEKAYMLSMFGLFDRMREVKFSKDPSKAFTLFKRILTQYEATSTSIVVDGVYINYFQDNGKAVKQEGASRYALDLLKAVRQEYEMIRRNFLEFGKDGVKRYKGYNDTLKGRGFTFNMLADMFGITAMNEADVDPTIIQNRDLLIDAARNNQSWNSIVADPENAAALLEMVEDYAAEQYKRFNDYLKEIGITEVDAPSTGSFEQFKGNFFFNNWINSMFVNQLFDGPIAVGISNFANYFKRQKAGAAAGSNIYSPSRSEYANMKTYRAAVLQDFVMYLDKNDRTKPLSLVPYEGPGNTKVLPFDGQSIGTMDRRIRIADSQGNLDQDSLMIMNRMRYETRSSREYREGIQKLRERDIVFNSIKSVTAGFQYIKQSEHTIIRKDVSMLRPGIEYATAMIDLENLYSQADYYAMQLELKGDEMDATTGKMVSELYTETIKQAHSYFRPAIKGPLGGFLHNLLNSMELHRVEQVYDTNASKRATAVPLEFDMVRDARPGEYLNLENAIDNIPNELTYIQVETSKIAKKVTSGIQQKLLLISQLDPNDPLYKEIKSDIDAYQNGLADAVSAQTKKMMRLFNTSDKKVIAKLYGSISAGLREQGQDASLLQYFEVDREGNPINPPSMPMLGNILTYYYFSMYNKNIFDKKIEGRKYYHISPVLTPVMEMDGKIVTRAEYKKDPRKYEKATSRFLTITSEEVESMNPNTGKMEKITKYTAEVIVPKELQKFKQEFVEKYLSEFFATRIPTEDKRSMFVAKIVDYMDEAYGNSIAVPMQIHALAGSDFDIDALYAYIKSSYTAVDGTMMVYGDYTHYKKEYGFSEKEAKFMEYLTSISKDEVIGDMVKEEMRKIKNQTDYRKEQAYNFGELFGGKIQEYFSKNASVLEESENIDSEDKIETFRRLIATFNVLSRLENSDLPTTPDALVRYIYETKSNPVVELTLNKILEAKNRILSNKNVFKRFFADPNIGAEEAVAPYKSLVERKGLTERDIYNKQNIFTPTALAVARSLNSESKDSLGIAASFNKGLSMLATINAELTGEITESPFHIETLNDKGKSVLKKVKVDRIVDNSVQLVGGLIGLFADAPKTPYPGPLHFNSNTTPVLASMLAAGIPQNAAIMFQSIPIVRNMVNMYNREYSSAYSRTAVSRKMSFTRFLQQQLDDMGSNESLQTQLTDFFSGERGEGAYKVIYNDDMITKDSAQDITNGTVPLQNYGFRIVNKKGIQASKEVENYLMLSQYERYARFGNEISFGITTMTDTLKALKPDFDRFDRLLNTYQKAMKGQLQFFKSESMEKLFRTYPVLTENYKALKHMSDISRMIFMDRTSMMKGFVSLFDTVWGYEKKDIRKDMASFIGMQLQRSMMEENPKGILPEIYLEQLNPDNFLGGQVIADYHDLRRKYPNNMFLNALKVVNVGQKTKGYRVLEMATSRLGSSGREAAFTDLQFLLHSDPETKVKAFRIAYHGMIKAGGQRVLGGYYDLLPSLLSRPMAKELWNLQRKLVELDLFVMKNFKKVENEDGTFSMPQEAKNNYRDLINDTLSDSFGNRKLSDLITEAVSKIISARIESDPNDPYVRVINPQKIAIKQGLKTITASDLLSFLDEVIPQTKQYVAEEYETEDGETGVKVPVVKGAVKSTLKKGSFDLFTPDMEGELLITIPEKLEEVFGEDLGKKSRNMLQESGIYDTGRGYRFPLYTINSRDQLLVLTGLDGRTLGDSFISTLAETESGSGDPKIQLIGLSAQYKVIESQGTAKISPMGFSTKEGMQIRNMIMGKAQSKTLAKTETLPSQMIVMYEKNRMFEFSPAKRPIGFNTEKTFTRMDGSTITTGKMLNRYEFVKGQLVMYPEAKEIGKLITPDLYDKFADAIGMSNWEYLSKSPRFTDFINGKANIFVYDLQNGDTMSPTSDPTKNRPDGITIEDMDQQIEDEKNKCN